MVGVYFSGTLKHYLVSLWISGIGDKDEVDVAYDLSEPTMGEKLASLNLEGNNEPNAETADPSLLAKPPSADSVNILVKQALHADDRALLIDCLYRQDEKASICAPFFLLVVLFLHSV